MSDSSRPHGLQPTRLLHPWDSPGKSAGVGAIAFSVSSLTRGQTSITSIPASGGRVLTTGPPDRPPDVWEEFNETAEYTEQRLLRSCPQTNLTLLSIYVFVASTKVDPGKLHQPPISPSKRTDLSCQMSPKPCTQPCE